MLNSLPSEFSLQNYGFSWGQQISLDKTGIKQTTELIVQTYIQFVLCPFTSKTHSQPLSVNVGDDLELYIFSSE